MSYHPRNRVLFPQGSTAFDVFGRQKVALPETLFDSKLLYDKSPLFWDEATVSGSGFTSTYLPNESAVLIETDGTVGRFVRQTFQRFNYQPGKAQEISQTGVLDPEGNGVISVGQRSSATGTPVDTLKVNSELNGPQRPEEFGVDFTEVNFTKSQIYTFEMEWLGVGLTRQGHVTGGQPKIFHYFLNDNINDKVYMRTPNLPLRYEIEVTETEVIKRIGYFDDENGLFIQSNSPVGASSLKCICGTVISSGGSQDTGLTRYASVEDVQASSAGTTYAVLGVRLKSTHIDATVKILQQSVLAATNDDFEWTLRFNPTVTGTFTYQDQTNSALQVALGAGATASGGVIMQGGFVEGNTSASIPLENSLRLGASIAGVVDEIVLCVTPITGGLDIYGGLTWRELL